ncbi:MAG: ParB/RepB/Spo0J family partition protein [Oligoflexia bacterium]|nr:ParB/RepB/Spo0J family partition protein [Oligoflexia bacterium]
MNIPTNPSPKQPNRPALGKGLASLLPSAAQVANTQPSQQNKTTPPPVLGLENKDRIPGVAMVDVSLIQVNQFQPRRDFDEAALRDLADSILANGIIQPLVVRRLDDGKYHLIAGERRLRASKIAGLQQVPVVVRKSSDKESLEIALVENIQREDLNCVDIALSYFQLSEDFHLTQEEIAKRVGKDRVSVANFLRLLKLPESIIDDLRQERLSLGHGKVLLSITDPVKRLEIRNKIIEKNLSVRDTEEYVNQLAEKTGQTLQKNKKKEVPLELRHFSERLGRSLGTRVKAKGDQYKGSIVIDYFSKEDLDRISEQLLR